MDRLYFFASWFLPLRTAVFATQIPWTLRWRLLSLQPIALLTYGLKFLPWVFSHGYKVIAIPTRGRHTVRAIVFKPPQALSKPSSAARVDHLRQLHIDFHGGAFIGGIAEYDAEFCSLLSDRTGAVVVSAEYRCAPAHVYPTAHEDAEDVIDWVLANAEKRWHADPKTLTVSGFSAGGNLMMAAGRRAKAAVGICASVDLRVPPWQKPKPAGFPTKDPTAFLMPLYDAYAGPGRPANTTDSRLNPILKPVAELPPRIFFVVAGIDILLAEELSFIERLKNEFDGDSGGTAEVLVFDKGFHGWLELPARLVHNEADREKAFGAAVDFIIDTNRPVDDLRDEVDQVDPGSL